MCICKYKIYEYISIILVGGFNHISWKMMEFVNGKDYPFFIMENEIHVWNHQPVIINHD